MNQEPKSRIHSIGKIILFLGIAALVTGIILLVTLPSSFAFWLTASSVLINIAGITLMTLKTY